VSRRLEAEGAVAWVFQANPDDWRITDYLAAAAEEPDTRCTVWEVKPESFGALMRVEQPVFIWIAAGSGKRQARGVAGIAACGRITGRAGMLADTQLESRSRSRDPKFEGPQFRVPVRIESVLGGRVIRGMLEAREPLAKLSILRWAKQRTTYPVLPTSSSPSMRCSHRRHSRCREPAFRRGGG
jgi:EVE domain